MKIIKYIYPGFLLGILLLLEVMSTVVVTASNEESSFFLSEESIIKQIPDGTEKYLLKGNGFYCLNHDRTLDNEAKIHYFEQFNINGTIFDGYYYHDETGKFISGNSYLVRIDNIIVPLGKGNEEVVFDGYYWVGNLGKLTATKQVRHLENLKIDENTFSGYYYFDESGKMNLDSKLCELDMNLEGEYFKGIYSFSDENGALHLDKGLDSLGYYTDEKGKVSDTFSLGISALKNPLEEIINESPGKWSIYIKDLETFEEMIIDSSKLLSASLIKAFVMASVYENYELITKNQAAIMGLDKDSNEVIEKINSLLDDMITVSDNEAFNELVRLHSVKHDFKAGARKINRFLREEGFKETSVLHTLSPSSSEEDGIGSNNITSVKECGHLLEKIYRGKCVSKEASEKMLNLLLDQNIKTKIPSGLSEDIVSANKTGETDMDQHDIAIVYGEKTDYVLCIMSQECPEETAIEQIRQISSIVYNYLNY